MAVSAVRDITNRDLLSGFLRDGGREGGWVSWKFWVGGCPDPPPPLPWGWDNSGSLGDSLSCSPCAFFYQLCTTSVQAINRVLNSK